MYKIERKNLKNILVNKKMMMSNSTIQTFRNIWFQIITYDIQIQADSMNIKTRSLLWIQLSYQNIYKTITKVLRTVFSN